MSRNIPRVIVELTERGFDVWRAVNDSPHHLVFGKQDDDALYRARVTNATDENDRIKIYPSGEELPDYFLLEWQNQLYAINADIIGEKQSMGFTLTNSSDMTEYNRKKANVLADHHIDTVIDTFTNKN